MSIIKVIKKQLKAWSKQEELVKGLKFLLFLGIFFIVLNLLTFLIPLEFFEYVVGWTVLLLLKFSGFEGQLFFQEPVLLFVNDLTIQISYMCSGLLEWTIIVSAILASVGISWKKRFFGALFATLFTFVFNVLRIVKTVWIIELFGLSWGEISHEFLFRVFLFLGIAGFYTVWFYWATGQLDDKVVGLKKFFVKLTK